MTQLRAALLATVSLGLFAAGCSNLPQGAALRADITRDADTLDGDLAFYQVTKALLPAVESWPGLYRERSSGWPGASSGSVGQVIQPGDTVEVQIWDNQSNSLLLSDGQRQATLGAMTVSPSGRVFIPYVGDVRISGMGPDRARKAIEGQLMAISPSAQVQLSLQSGRQNSVDLVSGVARPGSFPLPNRNFSVLGLLSQGGGVSGLRNPRVRLQRGNKTYRASLKRLYEEPRLDAVLIGGDKVIVEEDDRFFMSLGAAGKEEIVYFDRERITALEAISMIGGLSDTRADPKGILVLREYPRSAVVAGVRGPRNERVVFAIDMTTADGLFSAKNLTIEPGDVVLATESPVTRIQTVVRLIGSGFGVINTASNLGTN